MKKGTVLFFELVLFTKNRTVPFFFLLFLCVGCATVPITSRNQLSLLSQAQLASLGQSSYEEELKRVKLSDNVAQQQMVFTVGNRIANATEDFLRGTGRAAELKYYQWEFNLIEEKKLVNAFAMPGGKIAVYSGLFPITQTEAGLAVVLSHEIAHILANHHNERMSQQLLVEMGSRSLSGAVASQPGRTQTVFQSLYGVGTSLAVLRPHGRLQESEADEIGLILMAMAGYDPREAVPLWQRMSSLSQREPIEVLSTHPANERRIRDIQAALPRALQYYKQ